MYSSLNRTEWARKHFQNTEKLGILWVRKPIWPVPHFHRRSSTCMADACSSPNGIQQRIEPILNKVAVDAQNHRVFSSSFNESWHLEASYEQHRPSAEITAALLVRRSSSEAERGSYSRLGVMQVLSSRRMSSDSLYKAGEPNEPEPCIK